MDQGLRCDVCKITLGSKNDLLNHVNGKKHQKTVKKNSNTPWIARVNNEPDLQVQKTSPNLKAPRKSKTSHGIFVTGFSSRITKDDLLGYFSNFGCIQSDHGKNNFMIINYSDPKVVSNIIKRHHWFMGCKLTVQEKSNFRDGKSTDHEEEKQLTEITKALQNINIMDTQLQILINNIQPDFNTVAPLYNRVCSELFEVLETRFTNCKVYPFGSTITGLSFKSSDVDVYVSGVQVYNKNDKSYLYRAKELLQESGKFTSVMAIPRANIPIIRCLHKQLRISCDINFKNKLGVYNSNLINHYLSIDPKLKPLMILIKYWAKVFKLTGQNHLIKNYALTVMLIFFLQNQPFNLPSVYDLQKNSTRVMEESWNAAFDCSTVHNEELSKHTSLSLFKMFLEFYIKFDFKNYIICPFLGKAIDKKTFVNLESVPDSFECYKSHCSKTRETFKFNKEVCVQDPFEHTRNITLLQSYVLEDFIDVCSETLKNLNENECEKNVLYNLFTFKYLKPQKLPEFTAGFSIAMRGNLDHLKKQIVQNDNADNDLRNLWFQLVKQFLISVLVDVLKFNVAETDALNVQDSNVLDRTCFDCKGGYNLWKNRGNLPSKTSSSIIEKEKEISNKILAATGDNCNNSLQIEFQILLLLKSDPVNAVIRLLGFRSNVQCFKSFAMFFMSQFPVWFDKHQNELNSSNDLPS